MIEKNIPKEKIFFSDSCPYLANDFTGHMGQTSESKETSDCSCVFSVIAIQSTVSTFSVPNFFKILFYRYI